MKSFYEAFPSFKYSGELKDIFDIAAVEKVTASSDLSTVNIYLHFNRLIDFETICDIKRIVGKTLFAGKDVKINIEERFTLSEQYTPENLFKSYKDSIYCLLQKSNPLEYYILKKADISFSEDNCMTFSVEKTDINKHVVDSITKSLEFIFNNKCGVPCRIVPVFTEPENLTDDSVEYAEPIIYTDNNIKTASDENFTKALKEDNALYGDSLTVVLEDKTKESKSPDNEKKSNTKKSRKSSNPDVIYGKDFSDDIIPIKDIIGEMGEVTVKGKIIEFDSRHINKNDLELLIFTLTDFTDSISVKMFVKPEELEQALLAVKPNNYIKLKGITTIDRFDGELIIASVRGIKKCDSFNINDRKDNAETKRVELHLHTKMSELDAVSSVEDIIQKVSDWGMDAVAITDHGNVQAFPDAFHKVQKLGEKAPKIIYGVEGYLVDDLKEIIINPKDYSLDDEFVVFDLETTGLSSKKDKIIEIGAVKIKSGVVIERYSSFVNPGIPIPYRIEKLTGIDDSMVMSSKKIDEIIFDFMGFVNNLPLVGHNADFDISFIKEACLQNNISFNPTVIDTLSLSRLLLPQLAKFKLDNVAKALSVSLNNHHRAVDDAACTAEIFIKLAKMLNERDIHYLKDIDNLCRTDKELIKKLNMYHVVILAANETGRVNLYRLISYSHIDYFSKRPRIPKSVLNQYREGLIVGSACEQGEIFNAVLKGDSDEELKRLIDFYDYLEIQPIGNNRFMLSDDRYAPETEEDLRNLNRKIVDLGNKFDKPVVATCDVHFLNPEDEIYRRIIMYGMGYDDADSQAPLYLRTTEEMLDEFTYLGVDKAYEVVVTNTRLIASKIENIAPVRPDKCPPVIENSDQILKESCYAKAHDQYGDILPETVEKRLEKELNSIISNGYAVMYIIAKKLVEKSNSDGYLVGSRGSVGSSFAAYTSGITEVNPLPPHYYCANCKYSEFDTPEVKAFAGGAGCDMPDKICPVCGKPLKKDGFDIPFETFLGFKGDKEPDIDLNFSGEYQSVAHAYTEVIFGEGSTFRAGTVGTLADKTAYGYVKKYFEEHGSAKRKCEINRLLTGCVGVKRTTGQHPGGIIVLPHGEEIYSFTPVQRPANDQNTDIVTTHFDYHAIDQNLLKLDILGHQAPTMIRMLQDLTGIDPVKDIPLDSAETMELFKNTKPLGLEPKDIGGCPLGSLGIPEFGTDFAMQMLIDAKPQGFADLVRIAGLSHGTNVWIGNAADLIASGTATIQSAICTRDDIMIYLIGMGVDPSQSFKIMESVRKGKGLKPEMEEAMREKNVPEWYLDSCKKIGYMFPKAHAAAYVMMSWRLAYCKIFYPLAFYAAYFSIMAGGFSYDIMCKGRDRLEQSMSELKKKGDKMTQKDSDQLKDMRIVQEFYARGFEFLPIDIYKSRAKNFIIEDGKIRPSFASIDGLGEVAANSIEEAAKKGNFISMDDFRSRAGIGKSLTDLLDSLNIGLDVPESNQISIFDMMK